MQRARRLTWSSIGTIALMVLLAACGGASSGPSGGIGLVDWPGDVGSVGPKPGERAPNFRLEEAGGGEILLSDHVGKPLLLNFFASWCTNCKEEMADLEEAYGDDVMVVGVDLRESAETVQKLAAETGATFPLALDRKGEVTREYRVANLPVTFLLDRDGTVREVVPGPVDDERIAELLASLPAATGDQPAEEG